jgi:hypothetical protein
MASILPLYTKDMQSSATVIPPTQTALYFCQEGQPDLLLHTNDILFEKFQKSTLFFLEFDPPIHESDTGAEFKYIHCLNMRFTSGILAITSPNIGKTLILNLEQGNLNKFRCINPGRYYLTQFSKL